MRAIAFSKEKHQLLERELPTPTPQGQEVLVKVNHLILTQKDLNETVSGSEIIPGRFFIGEVIATGSEVKNYAPGDVVSSITTFYCESCEPCEVSEYHLCEKPLIPGKDTNGFFAEFAIIKESFLFKIPPEIPGKKAAFLPLIVELLDYIPEEIQPGAAGIVIASSIEDVIFNSLLHTLGFIETAILSASARLRTFLKPDLRSLYIEEPSGLFQFFEGNGVKPNFAFDFTGNWAFLKAALQVLKPGATLFLAETLRNEDVQNLLEFAKPKKLNIRMRNLLPIKDKVSYAIKVLQTHSINPEEFLTHIFNLNDTEKITKILSQEPSLIMVNF